MPCTVSGDLVNSVSYTVPKPVQLHGIQNEMQDKVSKKWSVIHCSAIHSSHIHSAFISHHVFVVIKKSLDDVIMDYIGLGLGFKI